jgi:hypothetical protein
VIGNSSGTGQFLGLVTGSSAGFITVQCLAIQYGSVGSGLPAGTSFIFPGSYIPSLANVGQVYANAANYAVGATTGTLALASALPGTSANRFLVIVTAALEFVNAGKQLTITGSGSGVSWPNSPQNYQNGQAGQFPAIFYGIANGGSTPSVTWTCNDSLGFTPMTMAMVCYFQS